MTNANLKNELEAEIEKDKAQVKPEPLPETDLVNISGGAKVDLTACKAFN